MQPSTDTEHNPLSLPNETLQAILDHIGQRDNQTLLSVCLASRRFNEIATPYLYKAIRLTPSNAALLRRTFESKSSLVQLVKCVQYVLPSSIAQGTRAGTEGVAVMSAVLPYCTDLEDFEVYGDGTDWLSELQPFYSLTRMHHLRSVTCSTNAATLALFSRGTCCRVLNLKDTPDEDQHPEDRNECLKLLFPGVQEVNVREHSIDSDNFSWDFRIIFPSVKTFSIDKLSSDELSAMVKKVGLTIHHLTLALECREREFHISQVKLEVDQTLASYRSCVPLSMAVRFTIPIEPTLSSCELCGVLSSGSFGAFEFSATFDRKEGSRNMDEIPETLLSVVTELLQDYVHIFRREGLAETAENQAYYAYQLTEGTKSQGWKQNVEKRIPYCLELEAGVTYVIRGHVCQSTVVEDEVEGPISLYYIRESQAV